MSPPSNNPSGRPSKKLAEAVQIIRGPSELIDAARTAAKREGVAISEWWRRAAYAYLSDGYGQMEAAAVSRHREHVKQQARSALDRLSPEAREQVMQRLKRGGR